MAKMNPHDKRHRNNLTMYQKMIEAIYNTAATEAARIASNTQGIDTDTPFRFDDYPQTRKRVAELMAQLKSRISVTVVNGIDAEWTLANNKNNELANRVFGKNVGRLSQAAYRRYYSTNDNAREAFLARKVGGLSLSQRVWCYAEQFKEEIEMGIDVGLRNGLSADQMSRDLRSYLRHPDKLFRRVRDERGQLHLSRAAAAFHPGQGVYRSSYMNARRLAVTETNMAYRTSDHTRWQQMDFVVGIEIVLSNNHTCKGPDGKPHPFHDICDELAGRYPKDFKFTGWHPHCRCHAVSILKTPKEIAEDTRKILNGEPVDGNSVNAVKDVPPAYRDWINSNSDRLARAKSSPYFLTDNPQYSKGVPSRLLTSNSEFELNIRQKDYDILLANSADNNPRINLLERLYREQGYTDNEVQKYRSLMNDHGYGSTQQEYADFELMEAMWDPNSRVGSLIRYNAAIEEAAARELIRRKGDVKIYRAGTLQRDSLSYTFKSEGVTVHTPDGDIHWHPDSSTTLEEMLKEFRLVGGLANRGFGYGEEEELFFIRRNRLYQTDDIAAAERARRIKAQEEYEKTHSQKAQEYNAILGENMPLIMSAMTSGPAKVQELMSIMTKANSEYDVSTLLRLIADIKAGKYK